MKNLILFFATLIAALDLSGQPATGITGTSDTSALQTTGIVPSDPTGYSSVPMNSVNPGTTDMTATEDLKPEQNQDMDESTADSRPQSGTILAGESEMGGGEFRIYTNQNTLCIKSSTRTGNDGTVTIFDLVGKEVYSSELTNTTMNKFRLDINNGYYIVKVVTGLEVHTQKILLSN
jgi:hypothetical protein